MLAEAANQFAEIQKFKKTNKALILILQEKTSGEKLVVANAQLYHGSQQDYVREAQAMYLLQKVSLLVRENIWTSYQASQKD